MRYDLQQILNNQDLLIDLEVQKDALFLANPNLLGQLNNIFPAGQRDYSVKAVLFLYLFFVDSDYVQLDEFIVSNYESLLEFKVDKVNETNINNYVSNQIAQNNISTQHDGLFDGLLNTLSGAGSYLMLGVLGLLVYKFVKD